VVTFTLDGVTIISSGTTRFDDASCANIASGDVLRVKGRRQANGSIAASEVKKTGSSSGSGGDVHHGPARRCVTPRTYVRRQVGAVRDSTRHRTGEEQAEYFVALPRRTDAQPAEIEQQDK
jgi:hypothetical protein